jgi:hypothetical protein
VLARLMCIARFCFVLQGRKLNNLLCEEQKISELSDCSVPHLFIAPFPLSFHLIINNIFGCHHSHIKLLTGNSFVICYLGGLFKQHKPKLHYRSIPESYSRLECLGLRPVVSSDPLETAPSYPAPEPFLMNRSYPQLHLFIRHKKSRALSFKQQPRPPLVER